MKLELSPEDKETLYDIASRYNISILLGRGKPEVISDEEMSIIISHRRVIDNNDPADETQVVLVKPRNSKTKGETHGKS